MSDRGDRSVEYERRRTKSLQFNLCFKCMSPKGDNKWNCDACLQKDRDKAAVRKASRSANNLCSCGRPVKTNHKQCESCVDYFREHQADRRSNHIAEGSCITCGKSPMPGTITCAECAKRATDATMRRYASRKKDGVCPFCGETVDDKSRCAVCHQKHLNNNIRQWKERRLGVLEHYGNQCVCCGESTYEFLEMDHINGGGTAHRKIVGSHIIDWIISHKYPADFQVLCANCNRGKGKFGTCPHHATPQLPSSRHGKHARNKRLKCINAYGEKCACCGEHNWAFLEFDHINNDGKQHRIELSTEKMITWLVNNDFPDTIQLLCCNCNKAKGLYGQCPHQKTRLTECL